MDSHEVTEAENILAAVNQVIKQTSFSETPHSNSSQFLFGARTNQILDTKHR
jgi:cyclophilin family peptidyl-prolyl cis-trans isomerase